MANYSPLVEGEEQRQQTIEVDEAPQEIKRNALKKPLTPWESSATVVNLVLATGPFAYPQGFVQLGPVISVPLLMICCFMAYITATYIIEAVAVTNAYDEDGETDLNISVFEESDYKSAEVAEKQNTPDKNIKSSKYYIRKKYELGIVADKIARPWVKNLLMFILVLYMYGAICLKYVGGAESFVAGVNFTFWGSKEPLGFEKAIGFDPYYIGLFVFGFFSTYFSFGDIQNAKVLQIVTTILRFVVTIMMCIGSIIYLSTDGSHIPKLIDWENQLPYIAKVFGNTTFAFIYHHSVAGIVYPVRPQKSIAPMFMWSNIIGAIFLCVEAMLAWLAFGALTNPCVEPADWDVTHPNTEFVEKFPCATSDLYNENFLALPGISQIVNFYPMLNIAAVPILNITLRNNLLEVLPIKKFLRDRNFALWLLEDDKPMVKGFWSILLTIPVIIIVTQLRNVQTLVTYTGGFCGAFILLIIPAAMVYFARLKETSNQAFKSTLAANKENINASPFQHKGWMYLVILWSAITLAAVVYKIITGGGGE